jgi:hypothetical protein
MATLFYQLSNQPGFCFALQSAYMQPRQGVRVLKRLATAAKNMRQHHPTIHL